jgi:hypothetical protein
LVEETGEENVVSVNFAQASQGSVRSQKNLGPVLISLAAVLAGLLVVGGMLNRSGTSQSSFTTAVVAVSSDHHVWHDVNVKSVAVDEPGESPFGLVLLEEIDQPIENFELADFNLEVLPNPGIVAPPAPLRPGNMVIGGGQVASYLSPIESLESYEGYRKCSFLFSEPESEGMLFDGMLNYSPSSSEFPKPSAETSSAILLEEYENVKDELASIITDIHNEAIDLESVQIRLTQIVKDQ